MATRFFNPSWRMPTDTASPSGTSNNQSKVSNFGFDLNVVTSKDFISTYDLSPVTTCSVSCWVKFNFTATSYQYVYILGAAGGAGEAFTLGKYPTTSGASANKFYTYDGNSAHLSTTVAADLTWYHTVVTQTGTTRKLYIDGSLVDTWTVDALAFATNQITIANYTNGLYTPDSVSQFALFDYELDSDEVVFLYGSGTPATPLGLDSNPIIYYPLGDQSAFNGTNFLVPNSVLQDYAFDFVGTSDDQIDLSSAISSAGEFTLSFWAYVTSASIGALSFPMGVDSGATDMVNFDQAGVIVVRIGYSSAADNHSFLEYLAPPNGHSGANNLVNDVWQQIIIIRDSSDDVRVWRNGVAYGIETGLNSSKTFTIDQLGCFNNTLGWTGMLSNIAWWTSDQTANIATIYNNGTPGDLTSLSPNSWWKLSTTSTWDQTAGEWTFPDAGSGSITGTSDNMGFDNLTPSVIGSGVTEAFQKYSFILDGVDQYTSLTSNTSTSTSFTVGFWTNCPGVDGYDTIVGSPSNTGGLLYALCMGTTGNLLYNDTTSGWTSLTDIAIDDGLWHFLAVTYDSSSTDYKGYVDGSLSLTVNGPLWAGRETNAHSFTMIGARAAGSGPFTGTLSNVSYFNSALSAANITALYNSGKPGDLSSFSPAPVAWWRLGENSYWSGSAWTMLDEIGTNHGTGTNIDVEDLEGEAPLSFANAISDTVADVDLVGTAPNSTSNALSVNMNVTARVTDVPS